MKLEDVEVGMKVVPHSKSIIGCLSDSIVWRKAQERKQPYLYVALVGCPYETSVHDAKKVILLEVEKEDPFGCDYFLPEDIEQWCDADEAPEGYYAVAEQSCSECAFYRELDCSNVACYDTDRKDGCSVIYKKKISCKEAFDEIDKLSVTVETVLGNAEGTIPTADPVNHPSHYTSGEIECINAIKASMSKEAFCGFLKGNQIKYLWRYEKKVNPAEDIKKAGWYRDRLEKELHDNSQNN